MWVDGCEWMGVGAMLSGTLSLSLSMSLHYYDIGYDSYV